MTGSRASVHAGIDVGGARKGFHAVALRHGKAPVTFHTDSANEMAAWCRDLGASLIGIDAPCRWRLGPEPRLAERQLIAQGVRLYPTPTRHRAKGIPFFAWMFNGEAMYEALSSTHPLLDPGRPRVGCFETFPHAVACALAGRVVSAKDKASERRALLEAAGVPTEGLMGQDQIDAALCALTARRVAEGRFAAYGEAETGFILVPSPEA